MKERQPKLELVQRQRAGNIAGRMLHTAVKRYLIQLQRAGDIAGEMFHTAVKRDLRGLETLTVKCSP